MLTYWLYIHPNAYIRPYTYKVPHLSYIHDLTPTYDLTRTYGFPILRYSNLLYAVAPYGSNAAYLSLYGLLWPCMTYTAFHIWNLSTVPGVTTTVSNHYNTPSQTCDFVTEDAFRQYLYHPYSNFFKASDYDSLLLLLMKISAGLTFP